MTQPSAAGPRERSAPERFRRLPERTPVRDTMAVHEQPTYPGALGFAALGSLPLAGGSGGGDACGADGA